MERIGNGARLAAAGEAGIMSRHHKSAGRPAKKTPASLSTDGGKCSA
jgi:hypothetical protein